MLKFLIFFLCVRCYFFYCLPWKRSYVNYYQSGNKIIFKITKLDKEGWIGIGFSSNSTVNTNTILVTSTRYSINQISNHKYFLNTSKEIIEEKQLFDTFVNSIDNLLIFQFSINSSYIINSSNIFLAHGNENFETEEFSLPKHSKIKIIENNLFKDYNFDCDTYHLSQFRILATAPYTYPFRLFFYVFLFCILIYFKDEQPLRSRRWTPFIIIFLQMIEISVKTIQESFDAEQQVKFKFHCFFSYFFLFPSFQI